MQTHNNYQQILAELVATLKMWREVLAPSDVETALNVGAALQELKLILAKDQSYQIPLTASRSEAISLAHVAIDLAPTPADCVALSRVMGYLRNPVAA